MYYIVSKELYHHGIMGQKWGVRRYQNPDGSLTAAGRERYENLRQTKVSEFKGKSKPGKLATVRPSSVDNVNDAKDVIKTDTKIIAKQAAKEMASDIMRWEKEGTSRHENLKGMNKQQLENFFEKKIEDNISKGSNYDPNLWDDNSFNFVMDDVIEEYGMPVDFDYDWKNKKVTSMNIT